MFNGAPGEQPRFALRRYNLRLRYEVKCPVADAVLVKPFFRLNDLRYLSGTAGDAVGYPVKLNQGYAKLLSDFATGYRAAPRLNHPDNALTEAGELPGSPGPAVEGGAFHGSTYLIMSEGLPSFICAPYIHASFYLVFDSQFVWLDARLVFDEFRRKCAGICNLY